MPTLNGTLTGQLSEALRDAFESVDDFEQFLYQMLGKRLANIVSVKEKYPTIAFKVIRTADAEGWALRLITAACEYRPADPALQAVAAEAGLSSAPSGLERVILEAAPYVDASTWRARLGELEGQVCRVTVPAGVRSAAGTGFLVGPGLVLTNYHVIDVLHRDMANPRDTRLLFGYRRSADGASVQGGTEFRLASDWLAAWRPPGKADDMPAPGAPLPEPDELDFALLRVDGTPGEEPIGKAGELPGAPSRGWLRLDQHGRDGFDAGYPLLILQHPQDAPLKLALGQSGGLNANETRLRHQVSTDRGSSGSPCFNARLELVGVHHAGDPDYDQSHKPGPNAAIPIAAIRGALSAA